MNKFLISCLTAFIAVASAVSIAYAQTSQPGASNRLPGVYAVITTNMGTIACKLFDKVAPLAVQNFIDLAEGTKEFTDPKNGNKVKRPYYDGTIFHRVIPGFMIQGGDPTGTGRGGPGYEFKDEIKSLKFNKIGRLAMANRGPNTNGGQFFITVQKSLPNLNGGYTIFGQVVEGQEVANAISRVQRGARDKPMADIVLETVTIERVK